MKTLAYSIALLFSFLLISSCKKDGVLPQPSGPDTTNVTGGNIDPGAKLVNVALYNLTLVGPFEIVFTGASNYTFIIPADGRITEAVKPGSYTVHIQAPVNDPNYTLSLIDAGMVKARGNSITVAASPSGNLQTVIIVATDLK